MLQLIISSHQSPYCCLLGHGCDRAPLCLWGCRLSSCWLGARWLFAELDGTELAKLLVQGHLVLPSHRLVLRTLKLVPQGLFGFSIALPQAWLWLQGTRHRAGYGCVLLWFGIAPPAGLGLEQGVTVLFLGMPEATAAPCSVLCIQGRPFPPCWWLPGVWRSL